LRHVRGGGQNAGDESDDFALLHAALTKASVAGLHRISPKGLLSFAGRLIHNGVMSLRDEDIAERWLYVDEIRAIADLRIMHGKVTELKSVVNGLEARYSSSDVVKYSDERILSENIARMDEVYLFYLGLKKRHYRIG